MRSNFIQEEQECMKIDESSKTLVAEASSESSTENDEKDRPQWDNKFQYLMAALGFAVGLGNIWRFPYLCKKNGGGIFFLKYIVVSKVLCGFLNVLTFLFQVHFSFLTFACFLLWVTPCIFWN